ncbi:TRAP transporter small permease [Thalassococcus sp. BH17M4-6]|uniref:TRAP transporter small permease n=1 Tax=Thalassococcus sp. BH17M4-6 TaxID=3413148 RepID=UPI003BD3C432
MYRHLNRIAERIAILLALASGFVLLGIVVLTCVSIIGRALVPLNIGLGPIRGIYDITEIGMAAAVFGFLPLTQYREAHARVDLFQTALPNAVNLGLDLLFNVAMFVAALVGSYRLYLGMLDKKSYGETTLIAQIPVWQGYALSLVGCVAFVVVAAFCILRSARRLLGRGTVGEPT